MILNLSGPASFITLANVLNRPTPSSFLTSNLQAITTIFNDIMATLETKIPNLHAHLTNPKLDLEPSVYLAPMLLSLFCNNKFGMDIASRIWDVYVFEGDELLVKAACATLAKLEGKLYGDRAEVLEIFASDQAFSLGREDDFMSLIRSMGKDCSSPKKYERRPSSW